MNIKTGVAIGSAAGLLLAVGLLYGASAAKVEEKLQGTWKLRAGEANGEALSAKQIQDAKLVIEGDQYRFTLDGKETITGVQKLGLASGTKTIDITDSTGPNKGQTCLGIYELQGDEFRVAFGTPGKARPSEFPTTPDSGYWMHIWNRVQE